MAIEFLSVAEGSIAYQRQVGNKKFPGIFYLYGFASDMEASKAVFLSNCCAKNGISFLRFDYRGCGRSTGNFAEETIGAWLEDSLEAFDQLTDGPQIVVGSSMGAWLGLLLARKRPERVKAFIGVAPAVDFTEELVWKKLTEAQRQTLLRDGVLDIKSPPMHAPITLRLIEEAREHLVLNGLPLQLSCPVRLLQGMKDSTVPWQHATRITQQIMQDDVHITLVKNGEHRLNTPEELDLLWKMVTNFL